MIKKKIQIKKWIKIKLRTTYIGPLQPIPNQTVHFTLIFNPATVFFTFSFYVLALRNKHKSLSFFSFFQSLSVLCLCHLKKTKKRESRSYWRREAREKHPAKRRVVLGLMEGKALRAHCPMHHFAIKKLLFLVHFNGTITTASYFNISIITRIDLVLNDISELYFILAPTTNINQLSSRLDVQVSQHFNGGRDLKWSSWSPLL